MQCPRCQAENRPQAKFCEECATPLARTCANCGTQLSATAKFCPECAHPVAEPTIVELRFRSPEAYTPKHLAEKILISKGALEGERKQVTVLFADLKGSMELLADRDPEEARKLLDPVLERMMGAVHRYEGTVNQVMGDGIMALFGAPLAHEDHAVRACYAALRMQESVKRYAGEVQRREGLPVNIRVGLNSGEVVVRAIGSDLHMDYTAVGQTTHVAARMEQMAQPGSILLTADALRLAEGYVHVKPLGAVPVKGLEAPIEVYEVTGAGLVRSRMEVAVARGLTRFVGRDAELDQLRKALERAAQGHGQVVGVVGEPGVGKSRLSWEFTHSHRTQGWLILESGSVSYGKATPYLASIDLLQAYFQIQARDDQRKITEKVTGKLLTLDEALKPTLPAFLALLDVPVEDPEWHAMEPPQRRQRTLDAIKRLLFRESLIQPLLLVFEDLHWIDSETQTLLDGVVESLPAARVLLLVTYRPEYQHGWGSMTYYTQLRIAPLPPDSAEELLQALLGEDRALQSPKQLLIERTEGNPFFLEESVRTLVETQVLVGERGAYRLAKALSNIQVPATVQAVLAARIDRLPREEKTLVQTAAVIGKDMSFALLQAIVDLPEQDLRRGLTHLIASEFLYEASLFPELEYTFKHALTHEVAYGSLLHDRRRDLHARILAAIEQRYAADRPAEQLGRLAHHASRAELWDRAVAYFREMARKAMKSGAYRGAVAGLEHALAAAEHLPQTRELLQQAIDLRFWLRHSLVALGDAARVHDHLRAARTLAHALGDQRRLAKLSVYMTHYFWYVNEHDQAIEVGRQAIALATDVADLALRLETSLYLGLAHYSHGDYARAIEVLTESAGVLERAPTDSREALLLATLGNSCLAMSLGQMGQFAKARARAEEALRSAERTQHPYPLVWACFGISCLGYLKEEIMDEAIPALERGLRVCEAGEIPDVAPFVAAFLGYAYARGRQAAVAVRFLDRFVAEARAQRRATYYSHIGFIAAEGYLLAGRPEEAIDIARRNLVLAREHDERGFEALAQRVLGEIASCREPLEVETTANCYWEAMSRAAELGMRPLVARCQLGLGKLFRRTGCRQEARQKLMDALTIANALDMRVLSQSAAAELKALA